MGVHNALGTAADTTLSVPCGGRAIVHRPLRRHRNGALSLLVSDEFIRLITGAFRLDPHGGDGMPRARLGDGGERVGHHGRCQVGVGRGIVVRRGLRGDGIVAKDGRGLELRWFWNGFWPRPFRTGSRSGGGTDAHPLAALLLHHLLRRADGGSRPRHPRSGGEARVGDGEQIRRRLGRWSCRRRGSRFQFGAFRNQRGGLVHNGRSGSHFRRRRRGSWRGGGGCSGGQEGKSA
mmetsp:Transcript_12638/g.24067  ORF Transcript_12638/g.24067 Transcript_12638/m.24067 type:complete len:234 (-) Transcript_12638:224-925(-)